MKTSFADSSLPENEYFIMFRVIYFHELLVFLEAFLTKAFSAKLVEFIADYLRQNRQEEFLSFLTLKRKASSRRQTAYLYNDRQSRPSV